MKWVASDRDEWFRRQGFAFRWWNIYIFSGIKRQTICYFYRFSIESNKTICDFYSYRPFSGFMFHLCDHTIFKRAVHNNLLIIQYYKLIIIWKSIVMQLQYSWWIRVFKPQCIIILYDNGFLGLYIITPCGVRLRFHHCT